MTTKQKKAREAKRRHVQARRDEIQKRWDERRACNLMAEVLPHVSDDPQAIQAEILHLAQWGSIPRLLDVVDPIAWRSLLELALRTIQLKEMPYQDYLQTPEWKARAEGVKERWQWKCALDSRHKAEHAHHRTYDRRGREHTDDLIALCADCHKRFHG